MKEWKVIESSTIVKSPWVSFMSDRCITESGFEIPDYLWVKARNPVVVVAITEDGKVPLVEQYRHGAKITSLEFPAGLIDDNMDALQQAKKELEEETGYTSNLFKLEKIIDLDPARIDRKDHICFAKNIVKLNQGQNLEETENINVKLYDFEQLDELVNEGKIKGSTFIAAALLALKNKDWFLREE